MPFLGGNSVKATSGINGALTKTQMKAGIKDSAEIFEADTISGLEARGITVLISGVRDAHDSVYRRLGVYEQLAHEEHVFRTTPEAIAHARAHVTA